MVYAMRVPDTYRTTSLTLSPAAPLPHVVPETAFKCWDTFDGRHRAQATAVTCLTGRFLFPCMPTGLTGELGRQQAFRLCVAKATRLALYHIVLRPLAIRC